MINIHFYISNHGFGHFTRSVSLIDELSSIGIRCHVTSNLIEGLFFDLYIKNVTSRIEAVDFGLIQNNWYDADIVKTKQELIRLWEDREAYIQKEMEYCRTHKIDYIITDIPFIPFEVAHRLGIPSCGVSNFDWHFIYSQVFKADINRDSTDIGYQQTIFDQDMDCYFVLEGIREYYQKADFGVKLPFSNNESMASFKKLVDADMLGSYIDEGTRKSIKKEVVRHFKIKPAKGIVLITFGGYKGNVIDIKALYKTGAYIFAKDFGEFDLSKFPRCIQIPKGYSFDDIFAAADIIITKTGYSTFAQAVKMRKKLVYTNRSGNPEDEVLQEAIADYPLGYKVPYNDIAAVNWKQVFHKLALLEDNQKPQNYRESNKSVALTILSNFFTENRKNHYAIIDVGTNNVLLLWAEINSEGIKTIHRALETSAMGKGMKDGIIKTAGLNRAKEILSIFLDYSRNFTDNIRVIGTSCSREGKNITELSDWMKANYGIHYEIITEEREALLAGLANREQFSNFSNVIFFDIGGGSTEFIYYRKNEIVFHKSLTIGVRRILSKKSGSRTTRTTRIKDLLAELPVDILKSFVLVGIGGTVTNISAVNQKLRVYDSQKVHKSKLTIEKIRYYWEKFICFSEAEIEFLMPFEPERAEVIVVGLQIVIAIMEHFDKKSIYVSDYGIQYGVAEEIKQEMKE